MGLDISHIKAVLDRPITTDPYKLGGVTEDDFFGFNVAFGHFSKYIQLIDCSHIRQSIIIVEDEKYLQETIDWFKKSQDPVFYKTSQEAFQKELDNFENEHHLKDLCTHVASHVVKWKVLYYYEIIRKTGFYTQEVGYQRKGVNEKFWKHFYSDTIYDFALKEDFEYAYSCVDYYWPSDTKKEVVERKRKFKEDFLNKYEFGASYLSISY